MKIRITDSKTADLREWENIWAHCEYATFFHSPEWMNIWHHYYDGLISPRSQHISFSDGKSAILVVSVKTRFNGWVSIHESSPGHSYGGWISLDELTPDHAELLSLYLFNHYPNLIWRINPFDPLNTSVHNNFSFKDDRAFTVPLKLSWDDLHKRMKKRKIVKKVKLADNSGFTLRKLGVESLDEYQSIYDEARERWAQKGAQGAVYNMSLFESFFKSEYCDFWGVFHDSRLICAGPVFRSKAHVVCWLTLAKTEYLPKKPYEFFYYNLISYYKGQGYSWFDFNPSGGLKGLEHFKKGFATTEFPCPVLDTRPAYMVVLQNIKSSLSS